jgi:clan AA aspartic protease (TIGR02281 family)
MNKSILYIILISSYFNIIYAQKVVEMNNINGIYQIPCKVNGIPMNFIFDTGASDVTISLTEAKFLLKQGLLDKTDFIKNIKYEIANGDIIEGTKINLKTIDIGGIILNNISASVINKQNSPLLLGQSALSKLGQYSINGNQLIINNIETNSKTENGIECSFDEFITFKSGCTKFDITNIINKSNNKISYDDHNAWMGFKSIESSLLKFDYLKTPLNRTIIRLKNKTECFNGIESNITLFIVEDCLYKIVVNISFEPNQYETMLEKYNAILKAIPDIYIYETKYNTSNDLKEKIGEGFKFITQAQKEDNIKTNRIKIGYEMQYGSLEYSTKLNSYSIEIEIIDLKNTKLTSSGY